MVKNQAMADALERFGEWQQWLEDALTEVAIFMGLGILPFVLEGGWKRGIGLPTTDGCDMGFVIQPFACASECTEKVRRQLRGKENTGFSMDSVPNATGWVC